MKIFLLCAVLLMAACGEGPSEVERSPLQLSGAVKLAADSLNVSLRITNVSDTTQVVQWLPCVGEHPTNFALYSDVQLKRRVWELRRMTGDGCSVGTEQKLLGPDESVLLRAAPVGVQQILGDSIAAGRYYVALRPQALSVRPHGGSYDTPINAVVAAGAVDLQQQ